MQVMGELRRLDRIEGAGINISILMTFDDGAFASARRFGAISPAHLE